MLWDADFAALYPVPHRIRVPNRLHVAIIGAESVSDSAFHHLLFKKKQENFNGRECRIRTYDPLLPKQVRYQTALIPVKYYVSNNFKEQ